MPFIFFLQFLFRFAIFMGNGGSMTKAQERKLDALVKKDPRLIDWWDESEGLDGEDDIWIFLADGYNFEGCSTIHSESYAAVVLDISMIQKGEPY
jgi:hypothetical protein